MASGAAGTAATVAEPENEAEILPYKDSRFTDLQKRAKALWSKRDAICNLEGFFQHFGECVNDAIQMFYTSSDTTKGAAQRKLIETNFDTFDFRRSIKEEDEAGMIDPDVLRIYMKAFQNRFIRHYLNEEMLCTLGEAKARDLLYRAKGRNTKQSMTALKLKKGFAAGEAPVKFRNYNRSKASLNVYLIPIVMRLLARIFGLPEAFKKQAFAFYSLDTVKYTPTIAGFLFGVQSAAKGGGHALCFYECGGKQFLYDDNGGPYRCDWRTLFEFIEARKGAGREVALYFSHFGPFFYHPFLYLQGESEVILIEHGKWNRLREAEGQPMMFLYGHYPDGSPAYIDLSDTARYAVQAIMPIYGGPGLFKKIVEPTRTRRQKLPVAGPSYVKPTLDDPILKGLFAKGGGVRERRTTRRIAKRA